MIENRNKLDPIEHELIGKEKGRLAERRTMREVSVLSGKLKHLLRERHRASLEVDGIDVLNANPVELEAAELASVIEWFKNEEALTHERYDELIESMGKHEFSNDLAADRFRA